MKMDKTDRFPSDLPNVTKVATRVPGVPFITPSVKNAINSLNKDKVTRVVKRNV